MSCQLRERVKVEEAIHTIDEPMEVSRSLRDAHPANCLLKIEPFSNFMESWLGRYESDEFEADGYKWKLCLYPNGKGGGNGTNQISLYVAICETCLPKGLEVNAHFKLFVYNFIEDKYLTFEDQRVRRFHWLKTEWGFENILPVDFIKNTSNGYLLADSCIFGAEIFVSKCANSIQCMSLTESSSENSYRWIINNFSGIKENIIYSDPFEVGETKWMLTLYPKGYGINQNKSLSLFVTVCNELTLALNWRFYAKFNLLIRDQVSNNHFKREGGKWFCQSERGWGSNKFLLLNELTHPSKGFIVNDTLIIEATIIMTRITQSFT